MTDPTPASKRRRVDTLSGIHKPFVLPLKGRTVNSSSTTTTPKPTSLRPATPSVLTSKDKASHLFTPSKSSTLTKSTSTFPSTPSTSLTLQKQLALLRAEVDTLQQARRILQENRGDELEALRVKWREATRLAAEELFVNVKERVNRMGGIAAWRDTERQKREKMEEWRREDEERAEEELEREFGDGGSEDGSISAEEDERNEGGQASNKRHKKIAREKAMASAEHRARRAELRAAKAEARQARKEAREMVKFEQENDDGDGFGAQEKEEQMQREKEKGMIGGDDDAYTMSMMLAQLNVDLHVIGYDKELQRWDD